MASQKLTPKQAAFVREYLIDRNATQAAIRAGYSLRTAKSTGYELLTYCEPVKRAIAEAEGRIAEAAGVTAVRVLEELAAIAFADLSQFAEWGGVVPEKVDGKIVKKPRPGKLHDSRKLNTRAVAEVKIDPNGTTTIKLTKKLPALRMLGEHFRLFDKPDPTKATRKDDSDFDGTLWDGDDDDDDEE
jgi:phage terminase small subunit